MAKLEEKSAIISQVLSTRPQDMWNQITGVVKSVESDSQALFYLLESTATTARRLVLREKEKLPHTFKFSQGDADFVAKFNARCCFDGAVWAGIDHLPMHDRLPMFLQNFISLMLKADFSEISRMPKHCLDQVSWIG